MPIEWVRDREPTYPGTYFVVVHFPQHSFQCKGVRRWDSGWQEMSPGEKVEKWLDGVE